MERKPRRSPDRMRFPASQLSGLSAFGSSMSAMTARHTYWRVQAGLQSVLRISRQSSPLVMLTFGWKIRVSKVTFGGAMGYSGEQSIRNQNLPPSYGESLGPRTLAFHFSTVSPIISRVMSGSGFLVISFSSCTRRFRAIASTGNERPGGEAL